MPPELKTSEKIGSLFSGIGKTLTATSLGLQGKDPSSIFDDLDKSESLSQLKTRAELAELMEPGSGSKIIRGAIGQGSESVVSQKNSIKELGGGLGVSSSGEITKISSKRDTLAGSETATIEPSAEVAGQREGIKEASKEEAKKEKSAQKAIVSKSRMTQSLVRSHEELRKKFPDIGEASASGFVSRVGATVGNKFGLNPETIRYEKTVKRAANAEARSIEGGRVTDQDRQVYADTMGNAALFPDITNIGLAADSLIEMYDLGGDITKVLAQNIISPIDFQQNITIETLKSEPSLGPKIVELLTSEQLDALTNEQLRALRGEF